MAAAPLLAIPPFPGARPPRFAVRGGQAQEDGVLAALAEHRVGGCYWGRQPALPAARQLLDGTAAPVSGALPWPQDCDPWHMLAAADHVRLPANDGRILLGIAAGHGVTVVGHEGREGPADDAMVAALLHHHLTDWTYHDPFSGKPISCRQAIQLAGFWRQMIDANRDIVAALGFAYWKKPTVAPLLWNGTEAPFRRDLPPQAAGQKVAVWRSRLNSRQSAALARSPATVLEVEDGFIRSTGLGADCVPPLSVSVDAIGVHFDPNQPSKLENLLQHGDFSPALVARAAALRAAIVASGLSKYERGEAKPLLRPGGDRRHVLVPGQVEDDRAVTSGGALASNLELLRRARVEAGRDAFLIYKPHPDVLAGHRRGHIATADVAALADHVETRAPMAALIAMADELHVNSSLAGFEALLRHKPVTVHGVPFYAGWGLTTDRGPVPARRTARRTLDELVAAALLLYPRYLDPNTGLPCPAEVLIARLTSAPATQDAKAAAVITLRRATGRVRSTLGKLENRTFRRR
ncbi:capsular polysaccharide export protein, LipB/KpsS family [Sandarakinorhabdus sp.]|uniref:capsular polysaccharide export protein, LipB/KpsS family n=1 Tax=Sandarakinorhabdus sp. TaxID=1916663 RepID=UPI003F6F3028